MVAIIPPDNPFICDLATKVLFLHERGARCLPVSTSNYYCMLIDWKSAKVFPRCCFEPLRRKLECTVWKVLKVALDKLSLLTASRHYRFMITSSHHNSPRWSNTCADCQSLLLFPWWLLVITIAPMMTSSHHNSVHVEATLCADCQSSLSFPWWLPVITQNATGGILCEEPISVQWLAVTIYSNSCWLEVIGFLADVRIKISGPRHRAVRGRPDDGVGGYGGFFGNKRLFSKEWSKNSLFSKL